MHTIRRLAVRLTKLAHHALAIAVVMLVLLNSSPAWAKKKGAEAEAAPTKSYVVPYLIVIMLVAVGLMTACRPAKRGDKVEDRHEKDNE